MAEEVQISNVGGDGVASEVTLLRLVASVEAMAKKAGIDPKAEAAKLQKLHNAAIAKGVSATSDATGATKDNTAAVKDATTETNRFARSLGGAVAAGLSSLYTSAIGLGKSFWNNSTSVEEFASQLPGLGRLLAPLGAYVDESIGSFRSLTASGAAFGGSITNMRNAAAGMEISLGEMTRLFTEQAPALASLGGTVEEGAARFAKMNKNMKATGDFRGLMQMGFSVEEVNEGMADYVELQARMGRLQGQSTEQLATGSANYLRQLDLLARVTGKTREEAARALESQAADSVARTLLNQFEEGSEEYRNLSSSLALLDEIGGETGDALKGMLTENLTPAAGRFMAMLGDSGDTVHAAMMQVGQGANPQVLLDAFKTAGGELEKFAGADAAGRVAIIRQLRENGDPMADYLDGAARLLQVGNRDFAAAQAQQAAQRAAQEEATQAMLTFEQNQREVSAALHKAFVASGVLDAIGAGLSAMAPLLSGIATSLTEFSTKVASGEWFGAITDLLGDALGGLWENAGIIGAIVAGIGALFAAKAATSALTSGIGGLIGRAFGGGASTSTPESPRSRANAGRGAGNAIGNIGAGIGKGLGGVLKGLAGGIAAFANPAVALGAAGLAASIVLIGGAIAGATWMVGKSLPTMAEGLKSFEELDGGKLIDAGAGMAAVAAGMAAFGVGSAIAGLGNLVGSVTEGIVGFFGGDDPLTKITKFQEYNFDKDRIENNASAIVSYSKGMAALGAAEGLQGIGAAVGAIGGAVAGLFGAEDPLDKIKRFQEYSFDTAKITANASAISAYADAMKDFPESPSVSLIDSFKNGIISLFGGNTDPFEPMKNFGEMSFNAQGIITNASAVKNFSEAMKVFAESDISSLEIPRNLSDRLTALNNVPAQNFQLLANGLTAIANVPGLQTNLDTLKNSLDADGVTRYADAIEDLVEKLEDLNEQLSKDNNGWSAGTGTNAGDVLGQIGAATSGTSEGTQQLNTTMQQILMILTEMRDINEDIESNTGNMVGANIAQGSVSVIGR